MGSYPSARVIVTDKLKSYTKPIKHMTKSDHRRHKGLNNRVENGHQPTRRKEKSLIKFKSPGGIQRTLTLMGRVRNIFAVPVGRYKNSASIQKHKFTINSMNGNINSLMNFPILWTLVHRPSKCLIHHIQQWCKIFRAGVNLLL